MQRSAFESFHPWVIVGYLAVVLVVTMSTMHPVMIGTTFVLSLAYSLFLCGRIVWKRTVIAGIPVAAFTMGILPLFRHNGATPLFYINDMAVTKENIIFGGMMTLLLLTVLQWFYVWNELLGADKIMYLIGRFLPAVSLVITMTLRYIPMLERRMAQIRAAQRGLGEPQGISGLLRQMSVLLSWSLEESIETSTAMETRGYGVRRRSSFHLYCFRKRDAYMLVVLGSLFVLIGWQLIGRIASCQYYPFIQYASVRQISILLGSFIGFALLPFIYDVWCFAYSAWRKRKGCARSEEKAIAQYLEKTYGVIAGSADAMQEKQPYPIPKSGEKLLSESNRREGENGWR